VARRHPETIGLVNRMSPYNIIIAVVTEKNRSEK
jgi:hypothetical protein